LDLQLNIKYSITLAKALAYPNKSQKGFIAHDLENKMFKSLKSEIKEVLLKGRASTVDLLVLIILD